MQKSIEWVVWMQSSTCSETESFTILLWNISNLKLVKKSKKYFFNKKIPKIQFAIEIV